MDKKNWFGSYCDSVKTKFRDSCETVRNAPAVFKKRIYLICGLCVFLFALALLSLLVSRIPAANSLKGLAIIALVSGIYLAMSLPQYMYAVSNYVVVEGTVVSVKQKESVKNTAKNLAMDIVMNRGRYKTVSVVLNDPFDENDEDNENSGEGMTEKGRLQLQVPDTFFIPVMTDHRYQFYYMTPETSISKNPYCIECFLFVKEKEKVTDADISTVVQRSDCLSGQRKEDHIG